MPNHHPDNPHDPDLPHEHHHGRDPSAEAPPMPAAATMRAELPIEGMT
jgi:hypothetical protein